MRVTRRMFVRSGLLAAAGGLWGCRFPRTGSPGAADDPFDLCIVGSGFAGTYLGLRAAAGGMRTVIVEAAPLTGLEALDDAFEVTNSGGTVYPANRTRKIAVGGTSNLWAGVINRLRPSDFRMRSEFGMEVDWPIGYDDLAAHYCEAEQLLATTGDPPVPEAEPPRSCAYPFETAAVDDALRLDLEGRPAAFFRVPRSRRKGAGRTVRLAQAEVDQFVAAERATFMAGMQAMKLVSGDGATIDELAARGIDGAEQRVRARTFVIAAGPLESARLLLLSPTSRHPEGVGNGRDLVGRHFVEHPGYTLRFKAGRGIDLPRETHRSYEMNDRFRRRGLNACHFQLSASKSGEITCKAQPELEARAENRVSLSSTGRDRFGAPLTDIRFDLSPRDKRTTEAALSVLEKLARELGCRESMEPRMGWRAHPAGTCRMGFDESGGVVDRDGKVFGTENVFVAGSAVFPTSGTSNPALSVVALTLRLADHILSRFGAA